MNAPVGRLRGELDVFDVILRYCNLVLLAKLVKLVQFSELVAFAPLGVAVSVIEISQFFVWN